MSYFFFQAEDGIRDIGVTGVQTCALPILPKNFKYEILATAGETVMEDGNLTPADMDGMAAFAHGSGTALIYNHEIGGQIGRASCRERVEISVVAVSL